MKYFKFKALLQKDSWVTPAYVGIDNAGVISYVSEMPPENAVALEDVQGLALPGFQNAHSHAFQYAMAGLAENHPTGMDDDFWTWREEMYRCALAVDPEQLEGIAAMLYAEMLRHGFTHVAEFHYLHHDKDGKPYAHLSEMGERLLSAASTSGIKITLIPVFYQKGGFGLDPQPRQRRFISKTIDDYFKLLEASKRSVQNFKDACLGFSVHSLRGVDLKDVIQTFLQGPRDLPFHLHAAEQKKEVSDCLAFCGKRPVQWLLENLPVSDRFNVVHATHLDDRELKSLAESGANVILCPSTEGNLGDGIFRMQDYCKLDGHWSVGTDSHIGLNPLEEFRMIDYRQRLITHRRNTFGGDAAGYMIGEEVERGRLAMGIPLKNYFSPGQPLDAVVYNADSPLLNDTADNKWLSTLVYAADSCSIQGTLVNGQWIVKKEHHIRSKPIADQFGRAIRALANRKEF
jgi:formimidoylglutamate deiminase